MGRLRKFPGSRFVGRRDLMVVLDCDDPAQFEELDEAEIELNLTMRNQLQSFAPDTLAEAHNRGFRSPSIRWT